MSVYGDNWKFPIIYDVIATGLCILGMNLVINATRIIQVFRINFMPSIECSIMILSVHIL